MLDTLNSVDLSDLSYQITCYVPGGTPYTAELDLPLSIALLSSYVQHSLSADALFIGELGLTTRVRPPADLRTSPILQ